MSSLDVQDWNYSIPLQDLCGAVQECIEAYGVVVLQNECDVSEEVFTKLLKLYFQPTFVMFEGKQWCKIAARALVSVSFRFLVILT